MTKKTCKALNFPKTATDASILKACRAEWMKRYLNADGTAKTNRWAPIYLTRGEQAMSVRLVGTSLILSAEIARIDAPSKKTTWG